MKHHKTLNGQLTDSVWVYSEVPSIPWKANQHFITFILIKFVLSILSSFVSTERASETVTD